MHYSLASKFLHWGHEDGLVAVYNVERGSTFCLDILGLEILKVVNQADVSFESCLESVSDFAIEGDEGFSLAEVVQQALSTLERHGFLETVAI